MWYVDSSSATLVSWSCSSNRQTSTASAPSVNSAKFVPSPSQVAPSGLGLPGHGRTRGPPNESSGTGGPADGPGRPRRPAGAETLTGCTSAGYRRGRNAPVTHADAAACGGTLRRPPIDQGVTVAEFVQLEVEDSIGTIRLDRPPMNALNVAVQEEIRAAALEATERADVRAVVLYGGPKVFAAGADIKEMVEMAYADMVDRSSGLQSSLTAVTQIPKPVIAAVTGYALGAGCELALTADLRICGDNAKLGQPEILLGVIPGAGGTQRLSRLVGPAKAKELCFTGRSAT